MRATEFLLEYSREITAQKLGPAMYMSWIKRTGQAGKPIDPTTQSQWIETMLMSLEAADPTPHKEYMPWIAKIVINGAKPEDVLSRGRAGLIRFHQLKIRKKLQPADRDINRLKTLTDLENLLDRYPDTEQAVVNKGSARTIYDDQSVRIIEVMDEAAACYYGQGTRWCTAAREHNMFDNYHKKGQIFIAIPKNPTHAGEKYQFHFQSGQFMDEKDEPADIEELTARIPAIRQAFMPLAKQFKSARFLLTNSDIRANYDDFFDSISNALTNAASASFTALKNERRIQSTRDLLALKRTIDPVNNEKFIDLIYTQATTMMDHIVSFISSAFAGDDLDDANVSDFAYDSVSEIMWDFIQLAAEILTRDDPDQRDEEEMELSFELIGIFTRIIKTEVKYTATNIWPQYFA